MVRRALTLGLATAAAIAAAAGPGIGDGVAKLPPGGGAAPARLLVYAQEWSLFPSRPSVKAGKLIVQLWIRRS